MLRKRYCRIISCENNRGTFDNDVCFFRFVNALFHKFNIIHASNRNASFNFRIPLQQEIRQKWENAIKVLYNMEVRGNNVTLCHFHFHPDQLVLKNKRYELKHGAVPAIGIKSDVEK